MDFPESAVSFNNDTFPVKCAPFFLRIPFHSLYFVTNFDSGAEEKQVEQFIKEIIPHPYGLP